jgi:hypothetical protein
MRRLVQPSALILRSAAGASRRMVEEVPALAGASFETPLARLLRMRAECEPEGWR